ncbi:hypothetical protein KP509_11G095800 [Ceratopteris richardii]|uniref:Uncharacterized protein n=1 Tax=Ceratopteris richardii TaxID=49495 RepID=A0A8T2TY88_CERRI|nr:hypothetical protein KP509_11G095800 [Ceratopteris richardii]
MHLLSHKLQAMCYTGVFMHLARSTKHHVGIYTEPPRMALKYTQKLLILYRLIHKMHPFNIVNCVGGFYINKYVRMSIHDGYKTYYVHISLGNNLCKVVKKMGHKIRCTVIR